MFFGYLAWNLKKEKLCDYEIGNEKETAGLGLGLRYLIGHCRQDIDRVLRGYVSVTVGPNGNV